MIPHRTRLNRLVSELRRRHVFGVSAGYAAVAFVVLQVADIVVEAGLPGWILTAALVAAIIGFPVTVVLAWVFDITPAGVQRTGAADEAGPESGASGSIALHISGRRLAIYAAAFGLAGMVGFGVTARYIAPAGGVSAQDDAALRSIAVLPFDDMSAGGEENGYLADGVTEEIITALANIADLRVVSRTSIMKYRSVTDKTLREIGRELGVATILEGSVRRDGDKVRITAQLVNARTDEHLWAQTYDRRVDDLFAIQSEIAQEIASALAAQLSTSEQRRLAQAPTENLTAYESYLRARQRLSNMRTADLDSAVALLRHALELDPEYALAWAELGTAFHQRAVGSGLSLWRDSAFAAAQRALALDSTLAEGHYSMGAIYLGIGQAEPALHAFRRAAELRPNYADAIVGMATLQMSLGRYDEAVRSSWHASMIEPDNAAHELAVASAFAALGEFGRAREWLDRAVAHQPNLWQAYALHARVALYEGQTGSAADRIRTMLTVAGGGGEPLALLAAGDVALRRGDVDAARTHYEAVLERVGESSELAPTTELGYIALRQGDDARATRYFQASADRVSELLWDLKGSAASLLHYEMAQVFAQSDPSSAVQFLRDAVGLGFRDYHHLRSDPLFAPIRGDAEFVRLVEELRAGVEQMRLRAAALRLETASGVHLHIVRPTPPRPPRG